MRRVELPPAPALLGLVSWSTNQPSPNVFPADEAGLHCGQITTILANDDWRVFPADEAWLNRGKIENPDAARPGNEVFPSMGSGSIAGYAATPH